MRRVPTRLQRAGGPLVLLALLALPAACFAQPGNIVEDFKENRRRAILEGTEAFRRVLFDAGLTALTGFADLDHKPNEKILVILGDLDSLPEGVIEFVRGGGAVLLASDRPLRERASQRLLRNLAGVSIGSHTLRCLEEASCYKGVDYCPFAVPLAGGEPALFADPSRGKSREVATNVPSFLVERGRVGAVRPIAVLPDRCFRELDDRRFGWPLFAVAGDLGAGRVLVMADHSVFINEMMIPTDNGNLEFAASAVDWLREGGRDKVLFLDEQGVQTKFEIPLKSIDIPVEEAMRLIFENRNQILATGENVLARLESDGAFDRGLMHLLDRAGFPPSRLGRYALVVPTVLLGLYALYRVGFRHRFRHDPTAPMLATLLDRDLPVAALAEQRHRSLLERGDLAEPAMHLARRWFGRFGVEVFAGATPAFESRGTWWRRRRLSARLRGVWRFAAGRAGRVVPRRLVALEGELSELRAAHKRGEWRLSGTGSPPAPGRAAEAAGPKGPGSKFEEGG